MDGTLQFFVAIDLIKPYRNDKNLNKKFKNIKIKKIKIPSIKQNFLKNHKSDNFLLRGFFQILIKKDSELMVFTNQSATYSSNYCTYKLDQKIHL